MLSTSASGWQHTSVQTHNSQILECGLVSDKGGGAGYGLVG
jgi:hypothetical protein